MDYLNVSSIIEDLSNLDKSDTSINEKCLYLAQALIHKKTTIYTLVENLGLLLVDPAPDKRELGTSILSEVLQNLPHDFLTSTELHFISSFYSDRLKDQHQVIPAVILGMLALVKMDNLPEGAPKKLLDALFTNVSCQQQQLKDRQNIYLIFIELLKRRSTEITALGLDFVLGFIQTIDGERDPRNLFLLFNWLPTFLKTVDLAHLTEEMFDVISCYFPIDFRTPQPQSISRDDLANALCPCLCAIPSFAEFCIPLIIDKLNSSLKIAKYDSLNLLAESCKTFDALYYEQNSHDIWDLLQREALNSNDSDLEDASLRAINAVIFKLSQSENKSFFNQCIFNLFDSLKGNLRPDAKLFLASSKILLAIARASKKSGEIIQPIVELLLNQFNLTKNSEQEILFKTLMEFVVVYIKLFEINDLTQIKILNDIPNFCIQSITHYNNEIRIISFESLSRIAKTLPEEIRNEIYKMFKCKIVAQEPEIVRKSLLKCFKTFANYYKSEVFDLLQSSKPETNDTIKLELYLDALSAIISEKYFAQFILPQVLDHATNNNLIVSKIAMKSLKKIVEENCFVKHVQEFFNRNVIDRILKWILSVLKEADFDLIKDVSCILKISIGFQTTDQEILINSHINNLLNMLDGDEKEKIIIILEGFLLRIRPEVEISGKTQIIQKLLQSSSVVQENIYLHACMLIANLINKWNEDEKFVIVLNELEIYIEQILQHAENNLQIKNMILLISWITKSLIIKGSNQSNLWTDKLILLLDKYEETAKSFRLIMDDSHDCLNKISFCNNRLLYRQKFFAYVCKKLSANYTTNKNYLTALGFLLELAPQQVIILYFKEILRLLVFCLELCTEPEALCAVLKTLNSLITAKEPLIENHIDDLLQRFMNLTKFEPSMKVRIHALICIKDFPNNYPIYKLLPHKQYVIFGLAHSLDDKKRLVRKIAVDARLSWFLLDAPT